MSNRRLDRTGQGAPYGGLGSRAMNREAAREEEEERERESGEAD